MNIYSIAKPLLFQLDAETAHDLTLKSLRFAEKTGFLSFYPKPPQCQSRTVMGIAFPNPVGLAAGLDKNGMVIDGMAALGFGFIEIGTITPRPQPGNPKPRLFRVKEAQGIINRFGFNNLGVDHLIQNVQAAKYRGILGINIGKNFDTPNERAVDDYLICLRKVYAYATYVTVNISSPNKTSCRSNLKHFLFAPIYHGILNELNQTLQQIFGNWYTIFCHKRVNFINEIEKYYSSINLSRCS